MESTSVFTLLTIVFAAAFYPCGAQQEVCTAYDLPFKHTRFAELCEELRTVEDNEFDLLFNNAPNVTGASPFPLRGCTYGDLVDFSSNATTFPKGCVVGNSWRAYYADLPENGGSWNGKCFRNFKSGVRPSEVMNVILSPDGQYAAEAFPTRVTVDSNSWSKKVDGNKRGVWVLDYANSEPEFGRDFTVYRDEMRQLSDHSIIGKVFTKNVRFPYTLYSSPVESFTFILFQVCDEEGEFAQLPYDRVTEYQRNERVIPQELLKFATGLT